MRDIVGKTLNPRALVLTVCLAAAGVTGQDMPKAADKGTDYSGEPFVVEKDTTDITFENDGTGVRDGSLRVRIQSDAGLQRYGLLTLLYQASAESIEIDYVRVRKPDGSVVTTPGDNVQDMPAAVTREAPFYSDLHEKHVSVKGLSVGDVLESHVVWRLTKPLIPGQFWLSFDAPADYVALDQQVRVSVPRDRALKWSSDPAKPVITDQGPRRIFTWTMSQVTPKWSKEQEPEDKAEKAKKEKTAEDAALGRLPHPGVGLSSFKDWEAVGGWYGSLVRDRAEASPEVRAKAAELTRNLETEEAKVRAIYNYVSGQIRYIGVAFGIGRYQPHTAAEVLSNQYGDCKDKHTLLTAMLSAIGVRAYPALINSTHQIDESVPSPGQFDHLITAVPRGDGYVWLDTTPEVARYGYIITPLRAKRALVIPRDGTPALVTTAPDPPGPSRQTFHMDATLDDKGTLTGAADLTVSGDDTEVLLRAALRKTPMAQWKDIAQWVSYRSGFGGDVSDVKVDSALNTEQPLHWTYKYTRKDYSDWANRRIGPPLPLVVLAHTEEKPEGAVRLGGPGDWQFSASLTLPAGSTPRLPPTRGLKESFAEYTATYEFKDGILRAERRMVARKRDVPVEDYEAYKKFAKAVQDDQSFLINLAGRARVTQSSYQEAIWELPNSANIEAERAYDDARAQSKKHSPDAEIESLKKAVAIDPTFTRAWLWLGEMYKWQHRQGQALEAYRSAIKNDPKEPLSYKVLAFNEVIFHQPEGAIATFQRLIAVAPEDPDGYAGLGMTLMTVRREKEGVTALETALKLDPARNELLLALGSAYLKIGQTAKAVEVLKRDLEVDTRSVVFNNAAYALAESDAELPLALQYAERAVREEENASAKITLADLNMQDVGRARALASYWDTLGWVHAKMGHLDRAQKYLEAAWTLSQFSVVGDHLGHLYERQKRSDQASRTLQLARAADRETAPSRNTNRPIGQTSPRPGAIPSPADREELTRLRTVKLQTITSDTASAEFFLLIGESSKVLDVKFISGDEVLKEAVKDLKAIAVNVQFPDGGTVRVVRRGVVTCFSQSGCSMVFYTPDRVQRLD